jgi:hypothetical protein
MILKFKALGLALVAVFAMSATVATTVQATAGTLTVDPNVLAIGTGEQEGETEFTLTDHPLSGGFALTKCKKAVFTGTEAVGSGATTLRVHPVQNECISFGQPSTVTTTGCDYLFHIGTPTAAKTGWHVTSDIVCSAGSAIKIVTGTCEVLIGSQNGLTTSEMTNKGGGGTTEMDLTLDIKNHSTKYTVTKDNIGCPLSGTGSFSKGDYGGALTIRGHDVVTGVPLGLTIH